MSKEAYERMYGKPADPNKVWEDRDELQSMMRTVHLRSWSIRNVAWQMSHAARGIEKIEQDRRISRRIDIIGIVVLLAIWTVFIYATS